MNDGNNFNPLGHNSEGKYVKAAFCAGLAGVTEDSARTILKLDAEGRVVHCVFKCAGGCPFLAAKVRRLNVKGDCLLGQTLLDFGEEKRK